MSGVTSSEQSTANTTAVNGLVNMISALDNSKPMRVGENFHTEYDWNKNKNDYQEQLLQIFFQSVRSDFITRYNLAMRFKKWVSSIFLKAYENDISTTERNDVLELAMYGYKMIAQLRDVEEGKGECRLAYDMLYAWYEGINDIIPKVRTTYDDIIPKVHTSYTTSLTNMNNLVTGMLAMEFMHVNNKKSNMVHSKITNIFVMSLLFFILPTCQTQPMCITNISNRFHYLHKKDGQGTELTHFGLHHRC